MSWVTAIWSMQIGACIALALPHLLMGFWSGRRAHFFFVLVALAVSGVAAAELSMMQTNSVRVFAEVLRWIQIPIFLLSIGLFGFVYYYLGQGRLWLGFAACGTRLICLVVNFLVGPNLSFQSITALRPISFLGEHVMVPIGVISPRVHLAELSSALLLIFALDASITGWRRGQGDNRPQAAIVGGSIAFFILVAASLTALAHRQVIDVPYMVSFPFAAIVIAMTFELGTDLFRAGQVTQRLELSESSLHESEERFTAMADAAPMMIWMSGSDKLCTFFNKAWLEFTGRTMRQEMGSGWTEAVHGEDLEKCLQTYNGAFDRGESFAMRYRLLNAAGEYRWVTDNGLPLYGPKGNIRGYLGTCIDITDQLNKERALREIEDRVTLAAEVAHLGIWELDTANNQFWISDNGRKLFGLEREVPLSYDTFRSLVHSEDRTGLESLVDRAIETKSGYEAEYPDPAARRYDSLDRRARPMRSGRKGRPDAFSRSLDGCDRSETGAATVSARDRSFSERDRFGRCRGTNRSDQRACRRVIRLSTR